MELEPVDNIKKIAVLRANGMGDFIVTLPAIQALRGTYPKAEIILLGKPWHADFLQHKRTPVDRVIIVPVSAGIREEEGVMENAEEQEQFFIKMQQEKFDIALHFHGKGLAANSFLKKLGAAYTVGSTCKEAAGLEASVPYYYYQNEMMRFLEIVKLAGVKTVDFNPELRVLPWDLEEASGFLPYSTKKYIVLHPCATDARRMWTKTKFAQLGDSLFKQNYQVVFTGDLKDRDTINAIIESMNYPAVNVSGKLSLGGLTGLMAGSCLVVSVDSGPLHLAQAVGAKTVGIYWAPNLINWGPLTRTRHRPVISWDLQCPQCKAIPNHPYPFEPETDCKHAVSFVRNVRVEEVMEQAIGLLEDE